MKVLPLVVNFNKIVSVIILTMVISCTHNWKEISAVNSKDEKISWLNDSVLNFKDFLCIQNQKFLAVVSTNIEYSVYENDSQIRLHLEAYFYPDLSYIYKPSLADTQLLKHENLHFAITELYARRFRKYYCDSFYLFFVKNRFNKKKFYETFHQMTYIDRSIYQESYDLETDHGLLIPKQEEWGNKIISELNLYSSYKFPIITINKNKNL